MLSSDLHFGDVAFLKLSALIEERRVVAHHVVDRDARGEGNTTLKILALLAGVSFLDFLFNHGIDSAADCGDIGAWNGKLNSFGEALCKQGNELAIEVGKCVW